MVPITSCRVVLKPELDYEAVEVEAEALEATASRSGSPSPSLHPSKVGRALEGPGAIRVYSCMCSATAIRGARPSLGVHASEGHAAYGTPTTARRAGEVADPRRPRASVFVERLD